MSTPEEAAWAPRDRVTCDNSVMGNAAQARLWQTASTQYGHFTTQQSKQTGVSREVLFKAARKGLIVRVHPSVYRLAAAARDWRGDLLAAVLATGPESVASHSSAAKLLGLHRVPAADQAEICAVGSALPLLDGVLVHRTRRLEPCDRTVVDGVPTTTGARTNIDLSARSDRVDTIALADETICRRLASRRWLYRRATALRAGRPGVEPLLRITRPGAEGEFWSWLERQAGGVLRRADLPPPLWNVPLLDASGRRMATGDAVYPRQRVVLFFDGLRFHLLPADRQRDVEQMNRLTLARYLVLRFTWEDVVRRPDTLVQQVTQSLQGAAVSTEAVI